jgi:hypothetical protein
MGWVCGVNGRDKECVPNFDEETSWKISIWISEKEMGGYHQNGSSRRSML